MKEESNNSWARVCDTCRSAACAVYCRADSAYLCAGCDARIHAANRVASRHERVWVCEACERAPAAFVCKADAASLCASCDADIHSANPLARRHHRVPVLPISGSLGHRPLEDNNNHENHDVDDEDDDQEDDEEAASWLLLPNPPPKPNNNAAGAFLFGGGGEVVDEYLDLVEYSTSNNSLGDHGIVNNQFGDDQGLYGGAPPQKMMIGGGGGGDSVVPCGDHLGGKGHNMMMMMMMMEQQQQQQGPQGFQLGLDHFDDHSPKGGYSYNNASITHSVSVSSMDVSVVPDTASMNDISIPHLRPRKGTIDLFSGPPIQMPAQLSPMDREARVLRYREKKKMRKFEKTIRYASRKAYAETRPRIKGRFAKRTDVEAEVDQIFSAALMADTGYGIVPSF